MSLYALTIVVALGIGLVVGLYLSRITESIATLTDTVLALAKRKADIPVAKPTAFIADPDDLALKAKFERDEARKALNQ